MTIPIEALRAAATQNGYRTLKDLGQEFGIGVSWTRWLLLKYNITRPPRPSRGRAGLLQDYRSRKHAKGICIYNGCWEPSRISRYCQRHQNLQNAHARRRYHQKKALT